MTSVRKYKEIFGTIDVTEHSGKTKTEISCRKREERKNNLLLNITANKDRVSLHLSSRRLGASNRRILSERTAA